MAQKLSGTRTSITSSLSCSLTYYPLKETSCYIKQNNPSELVCVVPACVVSINLSTLEIPWSPDSNYRIEFDPGFFVEDPISNSYGRFTEFPSHTVSFKSNTIPTPTYNPALNASATLVNDYITLTFPRAMKRGTGDIVLWKIGSPNSIVKTFSNNSILFLNDNATIKFDVRGLLSPNTTYYLLIDSTAFCDYDNFYYPGITTTTGYRWTTADEPYFHDLISLIGFVGNLNSDFVRIRRSNANAISSNITASSTAKAIKRITKTLSAVSTVVVSGGKKQFGVMSTTVVSTVSVQGLKVKFGVITINSSASVNVSAKSNKFASSAITGQFAVTCSPTLIPIFVKSTVVANVDAYTRFTSQIYVNAPVLFNNDTTALFPAGPRYKFYDAPSYTGAGDGIDEAHKNLFIDGDYGYLIKNQELLKCDLTSGTIINRYDMGNSIGQISANDTTFAGLLISSTTSKTINVYNKSDYSLKYSKTITTGTSSASGTYIKLTNDYLVVGDSTYNSSTGIVYVYNASTGSLLYTIPYSTTSGFFGIQFDVYGNYLAVGAQYETNSSAATGKVYVYDLTTGSLSKTFVNPSTSITRFGYRCRLTSSKIVITSTSGNSTDTLYVYDFASSTLNYNINLTGIKLSDINDTYFIASSNSNRPKVYELSTGNFVTTLTNLGTDTSNVISMNNNYILSFVNANYGAGDFPNGIIYKF